MQIREQGRKIQCIRTVYDKAIGRGRQTVIATLARYTTEMPTTGLDELTEAERETLAEWLAKRREASQKSQEAYTAMSADRWLVTLAKAIREGQELRPEQAAAIWHGMGRSARPCARLATRSPRRLERVSQSIRLIPRIKGRGHQRGNDRAVWSSWALRLVRPSFWCLNLSSSRYMRPVRAL